mgnify:CR=1 FL=1
MNTGIQRFKKGSIVNFQFMFPDKTRRLLFCLRNKNSSKNIAEQIIENPSMEKGVAEVVVSNTGAGELEPGFYEWCIFALSSDGSRDCWQAFSEGVVEFFEDSPSDNQDVLDLNFLQQQGLKNDEKSAIIY